MYLPFPAAYRSLSRPSSAPSAKAFALRPFSLDLFSRFEFLSLRELFFLLVLVFQLRLFVVFLPKFLCSKNFTSLCFYLFYRVLFSFQGSTSRLHLFSLMLVGSNGFEPSTSRLSGARSSLLSYEPISTGACLLGGDEEVRTLDLLRARQALSQLSYTPVLSSESPLSGPSKLNNIQSKLFSPCT